jgi:hypothetical protein
MTPNYWFIQHTAPHNSGACCLTKSKEITENLCPATTRTGDISLQKAARLGATLPAAPAQRNGGYSPPLTRFQLPSRSPRSAHFQCSAPAVRGRLLLAPIPAVGRSLPCRRRPRQCRSHSPPTSPHLASRSQQLPGGPAAAGPRVVERRRGANSN